MIAWVESGRASIHGTVQEHGADRSWYDFAVFTGKCKIEKDFISTGRRRLPGKA